METLLIALIIFAAAFIVIQLHTLTMAIVGALSGAKIENYGIFMGSPLLKFNVGSIPVTINYLPFGGFVKFSEDFEQIAIWKRILIALSGNAVLLATAMICLSFGVGFDKFLRGFWQIPLGAVSPFSVGKDLIAALVEFARQSSLVALLGVLAAKMAAFNLFPLGSLNGGFILQSLVKAVLPLPEIAVERYQVISLFVLLLVYLSFLVAAVNYFLS